MGADFISRSFEKCTISSLTEEVNAACRSAAHEFGHGPYSGNWGEKIGKGLSHGNKTFHSYEDADDWLVNNADKWGPLIAVKLLRVPKNCNLKSIDRKLEAENKKLRNLLIEVGELGAFCNANAEVKPLLRTVLERVKSGKSKFKSCDDCGSKVSTAHLKHHVCPVCGNKDFLLTDTDKKKLQKMHEKIDALRADISDLEDQRKSKIEAATKADKNKNNWHWLVGGWCSS
jgi:predicted RNA-binding Zn-ribbon protein involved in translation (DUF1610 family)